MNRRLFNVLPLCLTVAVLLLLPQFAEAKYIGADPPKCPTCCGGCTRPSLWEASNTTSMISRTEGNLMEPVGISSIRSAFGSTLSFSLIYNSYNADGSRATVDSVVGYGWTHSFNNFLFSQLGSMF